MHCNADSHCEHIKGCRVQIKVNILNHEKNGPFHDTISVYHYLSRNPKFMMETVN